MNKYIFLDIHGVLATEESIDKLSVECKID